MVLDYLKKPEVKRVLSVDPASHSLAWVVSEYSDGIKIIKSDKIVFTKGSSLEDKFNQIKINIESICKLYDVNVCVIEQSVYIQNFQTSRILSYIIGYTWGIASLYCHTVLDVSPLVWRSGVGYKNLTAKDKASLSSDGVKKSIELKKKQERKKRVRDIIQKELPDAKVDLGDDDIVDAAGIGLWYWKTKINNV